MADLGTVKAVVVAYRNTDDLRAALDGLERRVDVIVVDNGVEAEVAGLCEERGVAYLTPGRNVGFAAAVNLGIRAALATGPCDVLLLNPDARVSVAVVEALADALHAHERIAAVSPRLFGETGEEQQVAWPVPSPRNAWVDALGLRRLVRPSEVFLIGAVLLLNGAALRDVGDFDERFFLYAEESDWELRALRRGWRVRLCDTLSATHVGAGSSSDEQRREALFHSSAELFSRKWYGPTGWQGVRAASLVGSLLRLALQGRDRRAEHAARARLYLQGPARAAGRRAVG
ncbi:glycosyltransferase [Motilibacter deserti]|uniref:Glycosyltransferase family 2 protein n=1 Tax=Motilibacter deserti TaxID=2714956 RepID=A0ABX0GU29_9ACTN|nr:glycosyltransferase family 2 protein [Motilibacter deserti]